MNDGARVRVHVCPLADFVEEIIDGGRREVREPDADLAAVLRWFFRDAANVW